MSSHSSGVSAQELVCDFLAGNELSPLCCNNYFKGPPTVQGVFLRLTVSQPVIMSAVPSGSTDPLLVCLKSQTFLDFLSLCSLPSSCCPVSRLAGLVEVQSPTHTQGSEHKSQASCENKPQHFS